MTQVEPDPEKKGTISKEDVETPVEDVPLEEIKPIEGGCGRKVDENDKRIHEKGEGPSFSRKCLIVTALFGVALALIIGLPVGLTRPKSTPTTTTTSEDKSPTKTSFHPRPVILDEDYGAFPDDIFSLALALQLEDVMDVRGVVATSMDPGLSAMCMAQHLSKAGVSDRTKVFIGMDIHDAPFRAGIWIPEDLVGFPLRDKCQATGQLATTSLLGIEDLADMLEQSERDDWVYIAVGGLTTVHTLAMDYPKAMQKVKDMIVMAANICGEKEIYDRVWAPVQETNVACDPTAANFVFSEDGPGDTLYVMPVGPGQDTIDGEPYQQIVKAHASGTCPGAEALLEFYFAWSEAARADDTILTHQEAMDYDPNVSSALRYDPTCIMMASQIFTTEDTSDDYVVIEEIPGGIW